MGDTQSPLASTDFRVQWETFKKQSKFQKRPDVASWPSLVRIHRHRELDGGGPWDSGEKSRERPRNLSVQFPVE